MYFIPEKPRVVSVRRKMSKMLHVTTMRPITNINYFPPIELTGRYEIGLIAIEILNYFPNITSLNNLFHYNNGEVITIEEGAYTLEDLNVYLQRKLRETIDYRVSPVVDEILGEEPISLSGNVVTGKCEMMCRFPVDFSHPRSIGTALGFSKNKVYQALELHVSRNKPNIFRTRSVRIECNLVSGSHAGSRSSHILHEVYLDSPSGYTQICVPTHPVYFEIPEGNITDLELRMCDQTGNLLDYRKNYTLLQIHLRPREKL